MNYKYKIEENEIVLSLEEHKIVSEEIANGKSIVFLRDGKMALNINFIRWIKETDSMTDSEIEKRNNILRILPEQRHQSSFSGELLPKRKGGFEKAINESYKACIVCKEIHYIPENKELCLVCSKDKITQEKEIAKK